MDNRSLWVVRVQEGVHLLSLTKRPRAAAPAAMSERLVAVVGDEMEAPSLVTVEVVITSAAHVAVVVDEDVLHCQMPQRPIDIEQVHESGF